jgi:hypothetical protein
MADHRQRMGALNLIIQQVGDRITSTVNQNLLLDAQMKGICTTIETAADAIRNDITDLRGRIIPDLRSASASLKSEVSDLHDLSVSLKSEVLDLQEKVTTIKDTIPATSPDPTPPASDAATRSLQPDGTQAPRETTSHPTPGEQPRPPEGVVPVGGNTTDTRPPPNRWGHHHHPADSHPPSGPLDGCDIHPTHRYDTSWYHQNDRNRCFDDPSGDGRRGFDVPPPGRNHNGHHLSDNAGPGQCGFEASYGARLNNDSHGDCRPRQSSMYRPGTTVCNPYGPRQVNTGADYDNYPLEGGCITSPRAADKERQVRNLSISRHDIAGLAASAYHGGCDGVDELTITFIHR